MTERCEQTSKSFFCQSRQSRFTVTWLPNLLGACIPGAFSEADPIYQASLHCIARSNCMCLQVSNAQEALCMQSGLWRYKPRIIMSRTDPINHHLSERSVVSISWRPRLVEGRESDLGLKYRASCCSLHSMHFLTFPLLLTWCILAPTPQLST